MKFKNINTNLNQMKPVKLAERLEKLCLEDLIAYMVDLEGDQMAYAFVLLSNEKRIGLIDSLEDDKIMEIAEVLGAKDLADIGRNMPTKTAEKLLKCIQEEKRDQVNRILSYESESVGSVMAVDYMIYEEYARIDEVLSSIKKSDLDGNRLELIWIKDSNNGLKGFAYLADLIRTKEKYLYDLMKPISLSAYVGDDQEILIGLAIDYNFPDIPVVDSGNRMVGLVPIEWTLGLLAEEFGEDLANLSGISEPGQGNYIGDSIWTISKSRVTWLAICLITASLTSLIIQRYENTLASSLLLAAYIPMLMDSGGNAGTQSSASIIQAMAKNKLRGMKVIIKEALIGLIVGLILVAINIVRMLVLDGSPKEIIVTVSITLLATIILSKVLGGLLPLTARKIKVDPTVMSGPIITTIVDTLVLILYFEIASLFIGL